MQNLTVFENHVSFEWDEAQAKLNEAAWLSFEAKKRAVRQCFMLHSSLFDFSLCYTCSSAEHLLNQGLELIRCHSAYCVVHDLAVLEE